jgi:hypothetical protein
MATRNHVAFVGRFLLRMVAWYLLPWAQLCDHITFKVVDRRPEWVTRFWYISAGLMAIVISLHVTAGIATFNALFGGHLYVSPCVCEAREQQTLHRFAIIRFKTGSILVDASHVCKAFGVLCMTIVSLAAQVCEAIWARPVGSLVSFLFVTCVSLAASLQSG